MVEQILRTPTEAGVVHRVSLPDGGFLVGDHCRRIRRHFRIADFAGAGFRSGLC